jgi:hypothetical protein
MWGKVVESGENLSEIAENQRLPNVCPAFPQEK